VISTVSKSYETKYYTNSIRSYYIHWYISTNCRVCYIYCTYDYSRPFAVFSRWSLDFLYPYIGPTLYAIFYRTVSTAHIDEVTLLWRGTDATHVGGIRGRAATGLGLIIAKDEQAVGARLELGAEERLVGSRIAPTADIIICLDTHVVKGANWFKALSRIGRILKKVIGKSF